RPVDNAQRIAGGAVAPRVATLPGKGRRTQWAIFKGYSQPQRHGIAHHAPTFHRPAAGPPFPAAPRAGRATADWPPDTIRRNPAVAGHISPFSRSMSDAAGTVPPSPRR